MNVIRELIGFVRGRPRYVGQLSTRAQIVIAGLLAATTLVAATTVVLAIVQEIR